MKLFGTLYDKTMQWSQHRFAPRWLSFVSFIEAIFFPIPPDVMLIPMAMSKPQQAVRYAAYTAIASVLGGIVGYFVGYIAFDWVKSTASAWGYAHYFDQAQIWFEQYGVWVVFLAGFSPIPYKVFTLYAGIMQLAFFPFVIAAAVSRLARFLLVAKIAAWGGEKYAPAIRRSIEIIGWATVALAVAAYFLYQLLK